MKLQRAPIGIIRSIRQVSLCREWVHLRGDHTLPGIEDFTPDDRAGDASDLCITRVESLNGQRRYDCEMAGENIEAAFGCRLPGACLEESLDPAKVKAARPVWDMALSCAMPVYSILPTADSDGVPVTLELLYLPFRRTAATESMVMSIHAFSEAGRFNRERLFQQQAPAAHTRFAVIIDPAVGQMDTGTAAKADLTEQIVVA